MPLRAREREHLLLGIEPSFTACANHDNLSTFSQLALIMLHIATDSCLLSLLSCRMHGCNYAIGYIIKHHQCNFCYHMHKYFMLVPTMASRWRFHTNNVRTVHGSPYTFSVKPKWRTVVFWFFATHSSAVVRPHFLHKPIASPHASCTDCCIVLCWSYPVAGDGGCSCMLLLHPVPTSAAAGPDLCTLCPDLCTLHPDLCTLRLWCFPSFNWCNHSTCTGGSCH